MNNDLRAGTLLIVRESRFGVAHRPLFLIWCKNFQTDVVGRLEFVGVSSARFI